MYEEDRMLAEECERLAKATVAASEWLARNRELAGRDFGSHERELRRAGRLFRGCATAAGRKMCVGVFGPSQAGKSYLVSSLAGDAERGLWARIGDTAHDFLSEINPAGGKESTGLVTRFTLAPPVPSPASPGACPVHIRLLSAVDVVKILANTYFSDAEHLDVPDREGMLAVLDELEKKTRSGPTGGLDRDDAEDLQEYIHKYFRGKARVQQLLDRHFWDRVIPLAPLLEDADRARLFGLIWDNVPAFTAFLEALFTCLRALNFAPEAFCPVTALVPRQNSIIDVATLNDLTPNQGDVLELTGLNGASAKLPRVHVAALTAELIILMRDKPADFFDHTDLLDFPGYRSRKMFVDLKKETEEPGKLKECFLRGKVAYLFERYCAERELTGLLLAIGSGVQEVQGLGGAVSNWISDTHGGTPEERSGRENSLFFILTKSDLEFEDKAGSRDVSTRWDTRMYASTEIFTSHDWLEHWDKNGPFANFFLMRNPTVKLYLFEHDDTGRETGLKQELLPFVRRFEAAFLQSPLIASHFSRKEAGWEAFLRPNDGGLSLIRDSLAPVCRPELKRRQITDLLRQQADKVRERLGAYWKTDDKEEERRQKAQLAQSLARVILGMVKSRRFGAFARHLTLRDHEIFDLYFQARYQMQEELAAASASPAGPGPSASAGATENSVDDMLADILGEDAILPPNSASARDAQSAAPSAPPIPPAPLATDEARSFGGQIEMFWLGKLRALADDAVFQRYFSFPPGLFSQFTHELGVGYARLGVRDALEDSLRKASRYANVEKERLLWKQAGLAAEAVNSYTAWLGLDPAEHDSRERTIAFGGKERTLFSPPPEAEGLPPLSEDPADYVGPMVMDWAAALIRLVDENVNFDGSRDFDPVENSRLRDILKEYEKQNLHSRSG
jgi:hypothetical protein